MPSINPLPHNTRRDGVTTDSWITPKWLLDRLGPFDMDPCACDPQPWPTAARMVTAAENGLTARWRGLVWMNPPYGRTIGDWLQRLAQHGNGLALVFARTDTRAFHDHVFPHASGILFLKGRITFHRPCGESTPAGHNSGGPSVLIAYGPTALSRIEACTDLGCITHLQSKPNF